MSITHQDIVAFVHREARLLDDRDLDQWLECYSPNATFWMPAWDDDDTLVKDPNKEVSLIYYSSRSGLEDRVFRLKTERSGASSPQPRTCHNIATLEVLQQAGSYVDLRFNWQTLSYRYKKIDSYFGTSFYTLDTNGDTPKIVSKKVVLKNDYIHQVIDIYHI